MTITVDAPICPSVFDAGLPTIDYDHCQSVDEAHDIISGALSFERIMFVHNRVNDVIRIVSRYGSSAGSSG